MRNTVTSRTVVEDYLANLNIPQYEFKHEWLYNKIEILTELKWFGYKFHNTWHAVEVYEQDMNEQLKGVKNENY